MKRRAFTFLELVIVMLIIVALAAVFLPMLGKAMKTGKRVRLTSDIQVISTALENFKQDTGDYPRVAATDTGAAVLCWSLVGPGGAATAPPAYVATTQYNPGDVATNAGVQYVCVKSAKGTAPPAVGTWAVFTSTDLNDGPGFRLRAGTAKVYGPYLNPEAIMVRGCELIDAMGNPILYYPASVAKPNTSIIVGGVAGYIDNQNKFSLFDARDNVSTLSMANFRAMMGDANGNGIIDAGETGVMLPFILYCAGPDGVFGPDSTSASDVKKCDDVTNFR